MRKELKRSKSVFYEEIFLSYWNNGRFKQLINIGYYSA
jgi:hypothetical protein